MSEEKTSQMNINIGKRLKWYLALCFILILAIVWGDEIYEIIVGIIGDEKDAFDIKSKIISTVVIIILAVATFILNLGRDLDLHNIIDRRFFKVRKKTGDIIVGELCAAARSLQIKNHEHMESSRKQVFNLFYHFVNRQDKERALAFTYWEQYFVNMYLIVGGVIFSIASGILLLLRWKVDVLLLIPALILAITALIYLSTTKSLAKKLYELPKQQISEIKNSNRDEFVSEVERRFEIGT